MNRLIIGAVLAVLAIGILTYGSEAQRRRPRGQQQQRTQQAPQSAAIAPALGDIRWGMSNRETFQHFRNEVVKRYQPRLTKAGGAIEEDRLRHEMNEEIQRIRRSYVRFNGQTTGWDVSFLRDEFTHRNNESMLVVRDGNSQNFYFFINDRLWKWYKAFDASVFAGQSFTQFAQALQGRFGRALPREGRMTDRGEEKRWLEWQDRNTRLRAIDENRFYGFYCLVFDDKDTLRNLDSLRTNRSARGTGNHALVEAVVSDDSEATTANQDIVDRITGRLRRRTDAPEEAAGMAGTMAGAASSTSMTSTSMTASSMSDIDDDPLRGLDL